MSEQWKSAGKCRECRRRDYCRKTCRARRKREEFSARLLAAAGLGGILEKAGQGLLERLRRDLGEPEEDPAKREEEAERLREEAEILKEAIGGEKEEARCTASDRGKDMS